MKRGKNVCRENPEYHADTDDSVSSPLVGKTLQHPCVLPVHLQGRFMYISNFFEINDR